jgi:hypothetical protein
VASADADGDGDLDLFLADGEVLRTLRNDGGLAFHALERVNLPSRPWSLSAMDLDGDGLADLVGRSEPEIWRLLNLGEPLAFGRRVYFHGDPAGGAGIASIDLDRDGDRDLVVAGGSGLVTFHQNDGAGSFAASPALATGAHLPPLAVADLDGDGDDDAALGDASAPRVLLLWNDGGLALRPGEPLGASGRVSSIAAADFDRDGDNDLAAATDGGHISMFLHNRGESFAAVQVPFAETLFFVSALDADGDGDIDLVTGWTSLGVDGAFSFLLNDGRASFDLGGTVPLGGLAMAARAGDFNGDGRTDLAVSILERTSCGPLFGCQVGSAISVFLSAGNDKFQEVRAAGGGLMSQGFEASDLDLDGDLDLALPQTGFVDFDAFYEGSSVDVLLNEGDGSFARASPIPTGTGPRAVAAADLDGDGLPDLAVASTRSISIAFAGLSERSPDRDRDGIPDECPAARFLRGDADADGALGLADAVALLERLFRGGPAPSCEKAADANDDGGVDMADPVSLLEHLFRGGPAPPPPHGGCGLDPSADSLGCEAQLPCA